MKVILFLVVIAASAALGIGYLSAPSVNIVAQQVGVGENNSVFSSITNGAMSVKVERTFGFLVSGDQVLPGYKDKIVECVFRSNVIVIDGSTVICKLTDGVNYATSKVIAEGKKIVTHDIPIASAITIPINFKISTTSNSPNNIHNIFFIIKEPLS